MEREKTLLKDHLTKKQEEPKLHSNGNENLPRRQQTSGNIVLEVASKTTKWKTLGLNLGVEAYMLDEIDANNVSEKEKCIHMLDHHISKCLECLDNNFQHLLKVSNIDIGNGANGSLVETSNCSTNDGFPCDNVGTQMDVNFEKRQNLFTYLIAEVVPDYRKLGRSFGLKREDIEKITHGCSSEKSIEVLVKVFRNIIDNRDITWSFCREKLSLFEEGIMAIKRLETQHPSLFNPPQENDGIILHLFKQKRTNGCGVVTFSHYYNINNELESLEKTSDEVNIDFGRNGNKNVWRFSEVQFLKEVNKHFRKQSQVLESKVYSAVKNEDCKVLLMLKKFFSQTEGFAVKGIDFEKHYKYFGKSNKEVCHDINWSDRIFFYCEQSNMLIFIGFANESNIQLVINSNIHVIQYAKSTYKSIQDSSLIHVGVVVCSDNISKEDCRNCKKCLDNRLVVPREDFEDLYSFKNWIKNICKLPSILQHQKECRGNNGFAKQFKEELFGYQSISDNQFPPIVPTFD